MAFDGRDGRFAGDGQPEVILADAANAAKALLVQRETPHRHDAAADARHFWIGRTSSQLQAGIVQFCESKLVVVVSVPSTVPPVISEYVSLP